MKTVAAAIVLLLLLPPLDVSLFGQPGSAAQLGAQLTSEDPKTKASAIRGLVALGAAAKSEVPAIEKALADPEWSVRWGATLALPQIVGQAEAANVFDRVIRTGSNQTAQGMALMGLNKCGPHAMPTVIWALDSKDEKIRKGGLSAAAAADIEGTLYSKILPLTLNQSLSFDARLYVLAHGIRRFFTEHNRWPVDFIEVQAYILKDNPLLTLAPLTKDFQIRLEPKEDGSLWVRPYTPQPDGTFKVGLFNVIQKPQKK